MKMLIQTLFKRKIFCMRMIAAIFLVCVTNSHTAFGDVPDAKENTNSIPGSPIWDAQATQTEKFDWIQLTSGEWLKGYLRVLYNDVLEFDSDNLELLKIDWEDVYAVRGQRLHSVRVEGQAPVTGVLTIIGDKVYIATEETVLEFDRNSLISIAYGASREIGYWVADISLGLDVRTGNSDQINYNAYAMAKRRTSTSRFSLDYLGIFSKTEGIQTADSHRVSTYYDILKARKFYWRPVFAEYFQDRFSNIEHRTTIGTGFGYHIIDTSKTEWDIGPGIAYQYTQNVSVEADQSSNSSTPAFVLGTSFDTELTNKIDFEASYRFNIVNQESGRYTHHATAAVSFELTNRLDLDLSLVWDRIQEPTPAEDGRVPEKDDIYLFFGIGFEL